MTFKELQDLVAYWVDDLNFGYFTVVQVKAFLNNAQKEVQKRIVKTGQNYYLKCVKTTLVQNQDKYALPSDFKKVNRLETLITNTFPQATNQLVSITTNQQNLIQFQNNNGDPLYYSLRKNALILYPIPITTKTLRLYYTYQIGNLVNDADVPDVPEEYHELIALYAAKDCFLKDARIPDLLLEKIKQYEEQLDSDANERQEDFPRSVVETEFSADAGFIW